MRNSAPPWRHLVAPTGRAHPRDPVEAAQGDPLSAYHLEAAIAYWHTRPGVPEKWTAMLGYYELLLTLKDHPVIRLNRAYVVAKARSRQRAIAQLQEMKSVENSCLYYALLAELHEPDDEVLARAYWRQALSLVEGESEKILLRQRLAQLGS